MTETTEKEYPFDFGPSSGREKKHDIPPRTIAPSSVHSAPPSKASHTAADAAARGLSSEQSGRGLVVSSLH